MGARVAVWLTLLMCAWSAPAYSQAETLEPPWWRRAPLPFLQEPPENLLNPTKPAPEAPVPLLKLVCPRLAEDAEKLPPFFRDSAIVLRVRSFYLNRLNSDGTQNEAWTLGGALAYRSGWLFNTFAIGAVGDTSQPLYAPHDTPGTLLLQPPQEPILVLEQLYGQVRYESYAVATGHRQLVDEGYVNPADNRMVPNTFDGATIKGTVGPVAYDVGYLSAMKTRAGEGFQDMAQVAGVRGEDRGLVLTRVSSSAISGLSLYAANYLVPDVFNTAYGNAEYSRGLAEAVSLSVAAQYTDQRDIGSAFLGNFSTWNTGMRTIVTWRELGIGAGVGFTGEGAAIRSPYGTWPGYLSFQEREFDRAGEKAWGAGMRYDADTATLLPLHARGLSVLLRYAQGADAIDPAANRPLPTVREGDLDITWNIPWLKGFQARFRNAYVDDGGRRTVQAFRIILDYEIPLF